MRNNYKWQFTGHNLHKWSKKEDANAIQVEKPIEYKYFDQTFDAIEISWRSAFKKSKTDFNDYLVPIFDKVTIEWLSISYWNNDPLILPKNIVKSPIKYLSISVQETCDLSILSWLPELEYLKLKCGAPLNLPDLSRLKHLKEVILESDGGDLSSVYQIKNLEKVWIKDPKTTIIEKFTSKKIKEIKLELDEVRLLSEKSDLSALEMFNIQTKQSIYIPNRYLDKSLKTIRLCGHKIETDQEITLLNVKDLELFNMENVPSIISPELVDFRALGITTKSINYVLKKAPNLETLKLLSDKIQHIDLSSEKHPKLQYFEFQMGQSDETLDLSAFAQLQTIKVVDGFQKNIQFPNHGNFISIDLCNLGNEIIEFNSITKALKLQRCDNKTLNVKNGGGQFYINECPILEEILLPNGVYWSTIINCSKLVKLNFTETPSLMTRCQITNCSALKTIPKEILFSSDLGSLSWEDKKEIRFSPKEFTQLKKDIKSLSQEEKEEIGAVLFERKIDDLQQVIQLLAIKSKVIFRMLQNILQAETIDFQALTLKDVHDKSVHLAGTFNEKKTILKNEIKELGMTIENKASASDFVIVGYGAILNYQASSTYLTEKQLTNFINTKNPKFLVKSATNEQVKKLRMILWSKDPDTENMALEMLKKGGLPEEVIGEAVVVAKTSIDKAVKRKFKAFLKGKVSEDWAKLISAHPNHLWKFPKELLAHYYRALCKREGAYFLEFLRSNYFDKPERQEVIDNFLIPHILEKPHYVSLPPLSASEMEQILRLPQLKGTLKRLHLAVIDHLPEVLGEHVTIKELILRGESLADIPDCVFKLTRVSELKIDWSGIKEVNDKILNLKQLKTVNIYNSKPLKVTQNIDDLPKLKRFYCSGGIKK